MRKTLFLFILVASGMFSSCKKEKTETKLSGNVDATIILNEVNKVRKEGCNCGTSYMPPVPALSWNNLLAEIAYKHSDDMQKQKYFAHNSKDGRTPAQRLTNEGYKFKTFGENIAMGSNTEVNVIKQWLASEGHCKNIMNKNVTEMGVGRSLTGNYWTQLFGKQ